VDVPIAAEALALFLALFALYSPVAALSSYLPIIRPYSHAQQLRLAVGLAVNAAGFVLLAIWVGELLLRLLGISTAALTATGGIALILAAVPLMRGTGEQQAVEQHAGDVAGPAVDPAVEQHAGDVAGPAVDPAAARATTVQSGAPRSVLFTPITFPLTVGGTTFAFAVAASADVGSTAGRLLLSIAAIAYAAVTGLTLYASGHVERRVSPQAGMILDRVAGILLTSIAVMLLTSGFTDLVLAAAGRN
jgi:multiple antibiotic resistance protein